MGNGSSAVSVSGNTLVACVPLDQILADPQPTYIKFDIEGAEREALAGAENTIRGARPILAVCVYHKPDDLWELPLYLRELLDDYRFFLRRHAEEAFDVVCYAVPRSRCLQSEKPAAQTKSGGTSAESAPQPSGVS